jgi:hypothetical protein
VAFALNQWIAGLEGGALVGSSLDIIAENQQGCRGKKNDGKDTKKKFLTAHGWLNSTIRLVFMIW